VVIELARAGQAVSFVARGGSMWPAVRSGAVVELTPCDPHTLAIGELAAYEREGQVVLHRVEGRRGEGSLGFRGDCLPGRDGDVPLDRVLGRARVVRQGRLHLRWPTRSHLVRAVRAVRALGRRLRPHG